jgi:hypothetical protein
MDRPIDEARGAAFHLQGLLCEGADARTGHPEKFAAQIDQGDDCVNGPFGL